MMAFTPDEKSKPVMGYPSITRYQHPPPPVFSTGYHQGYDTPYQSYLNNQKPYVSPIPHGYYNNQQYGALVTDDSGGSTFGRVMFALMICLIVGMCLISLVIWMLFGTEVPDFSVSSLSVSSFNITNSTLEANWDVNVTVSNPNPSLQVEFDHIKTSILFRNNILAVASEPPLNLMPQQNINIRSKLETSSMGKSPLKEGVVSDIEKERSAGAVSFSLRLALKSKFTSKSSWRIETIRVFCEGLKVSLTPAGAGNMTPTATECLIFT